MSARLIMFASLSLLAVSAEAHPDRLLEALSAIDVIPTRAVLASVGASEAELLAVSTDPQLPRYTRARAAAMLGLFPTRAADKGLRELCTNTKLDREVRIQAMFSLGFVASALGAFDAKDVLAKLARSDPDPEVRKLAKDVRVLAPPPTER
ncbi:MAG: HEAT repeat domain-containing protein [Deltaproteobacteria bacterium]|nr:HEAT repeat domain-containing protein [Deltaproteobacteria bacterium]